MNRFFVEGKALLGEHCYLSREDSRHLSRVLRLSVGDCCEVVVEEQAFLAEVVLSDPSGSEVILREALERSGEPKLFIHLFQGMAKGSKMDWILQKGTEIGISAFTPVYMGRSVVKPKEKSHKEERWTAIVEEAAKQCKRNRLPEVHSARAFSDCLSTLKALDAVVVPYEEARTGSMKEIPWGDIHSLGIVIGPEGGFLPEEVEALEALGAYTVSLGPRILRTETAGLVSAAVAVYETGDLDLS